VPLPPDAVVAARLRRLTVIGVVAVVLLALLVVGLVVWLVLLSRQDHNSGPTVHPSNTVGISSSPPSPAAVPFDVMQGLPTPLTVSAIGTWDGVAVFDLTYQADGFTGNQGGYTVYRDTLRGVSTSTGKVLWTMDKLQDGSAFHAQSQPFLGRVSAGNLAISLQTVGTDTNPGDDATYCPGLSYLAVISLQTGKTSFTKPLAAMCKPNSSGVTRWTSQVVVAYEVGIVVLDQFTSLSSTSGSYPHVSKTLAYRDDDLSAPVWQVNGDMKLDDSAPTTFEIAQQWVLAASWEYVSIMDGTTSNISYAEGRIVTDVDGVVVVSQPGDLVAWASPADPDPTWSTNGAGLALDVHSFPLECATPDVMVVKGTSGGMVAIGLKDGQQLWHMATGSQAGCIGLRNGSQELIGLRDGSTFKLLDAFTSTVLSKQDGFGSTSGSSLPVLCGSGMVCVIDAASNETKITGSDYSTGTLGVPWTISLDTKDAGQKVDTSGMTNVFQMYGHIVLVFHNAHGWDFMTL